MTRFVTILFVFLYIIKVCKTHVVVQLQQQRIKKSEEIGRAARTNFENAAENIKRNYLNGAKGIANGELQTDFSGIGLSRNAHATKQLSKATARTVTRDAVIQWESSMHQYNSNVSDNVTARWLEGNGGTDSHGCILQVNPRSVDEFNEQVLYRKANIITLTLRFPESINVTSSDGVILPLEWRWVYKESSSYVKMPYASFVWSLGLLYIHAKGPINIDLVNKGSLNHCQNFTIGKPESDRIIGDALGNMTQTIAMKEMRYNTSKWCYQRKIPKHQISAQIGWNLFHVSPTIEYVCCELVVPKMHVECSQRQEYDSIWWEIHQTLGRLMLLYFPLLFLKMSGKIHDKIRMSSNKDDKSNDEIKETTTDYDRFLFLEDTSPVTAGSMVCACLSGLLPAKQSTKSRLAIFVWSLSTLILPGIELLMWYFWLYEYAIDLAKNGVSFGFSAILAGWAESKLKLGILGGPFVALGLYLVIGWLLMLVPRDMSKLIYLGVGEGSETLNSILFLSLDRKEILGSVHIRKHNNGYTRSYKQQLCHLYMLLNPDFWVLGMRIVRSRWARFSSCMKQNKVPCCLFSLCFPVYILYSVIEIVTAFAYYSIPMFSFFVCVVKGFTKGLDNYLSEKWHRSGYVLRVPLCLVVILFQMYYLFMFIKMFLQSFNFLARVLVFTYTAIVAYPQKTYGYFMLIITTLSFGTKQFVSFGSNYKRILKITVQLCKKEDSLEKHLVLKKDICGDDICGVSRNLFEYLVENTLPRRIQMFHTLLRLASVVFVLSISIEIMLKFEKFEDLSFFVHVFIALFICALPSIYSSVVSTGQTKRTLTRKIKKCLQKWDTDVCLTD